MKSAEKMYVLMLCLFPAVTFNSVTFYPPIPQGGTNTHTDNNLVVEKSLVYLCDDLCVTLWLIKNT